MLIESENSPANVDSRVVTADNRSGIYCVASDEHVASVSREGSRRSCMFQSFFDGAKKFSRRNHSRLRLNLNLAFPSPSPPLSHLCFLATPLHPSFSRCGYCDKKREMIFQISFGRLYRVPATTPPVKSPD